MNEPALAITATVPARAALAGNPSDGYGGAVFGVSVPAYDATVQLDSLDQCYVLVDAQSGRATYQRWADLEKALTSATARSPHCLLLGVLAEIAGRNGTDPPFRISATTTIPTPRNRRRAPGSGGSGIQPTDAAFAAGDDVRHGSATDATFDTRTAILDLGRGHVEMIEAARAAGAHANFTGSGGSVVVLAPSADVEAAARQSLNSLGCMIVSIETASPDDKSGAG